VPVGLVPGGAAVGSGTPGGQCQWSPWPSHSPEGLVTVGVTVGVVPGGGVVGSGMPGGQCQWSP
jgi:hypothetical protein